MAQRHITGVIAVGALCAVAGATVFGITSSSAATSTTAAKAASAAANGMPPGGPGGFGGPGGGPGGHGGPGGGGPGGGGPDGGGIHTESVRADLDGSGFITMVNDSGTVSAINGSTLTLKEGTATDTYDTVEVKVDGTVTVERNGATAKLASIKVGDHVRISKDGTNTRVTASTAAFEKSQAVARQKEQQTRAAAQTWPAL